MGRLMASVSEVIDVAVSAMTGRQKLTKDIDDIIFP